MSDDQNTPEITPEIPAETPTPETPVTTPVEPTPEEPRDLDHERDLRVAPVAQGVIEDIAGQSTVLDVNNRSEFNNVLMKILQRALDADLNLTTDNPYIFQLILGAYGSFNKFVMSCKMAEQENIRYASIAHQMMAHLATAKLPMGEKVTSEDQAQALEAIRPQMEELFETEKLTQLEVTYILEGLMNALKVTEQTFRNSVNQAVNDMEAKILQVDDVTDLTMKKLDETLKTNIDEILSKATK